MDTSRIDDIRTPFTHLQAHLDPVELGRLEEFRRLQTAEQMFSVERLGLLFMQFIQDPALEQFLVRHADLRL